MIINRGVRGFVIGRFHFQFWPDLSHWEFTLTFSELYWTWYLQIGPICLGWFDKKWAHSPLKK